MDCPARCLRRADPLGFILKKTLRKPDKLRFKSEFERVRADGTKLVGPSMLLVYAAAPDSSLRCGVICGRKYSLLAVKRNRARRLLWESFRILRGTLPPVWMILIPRNRMKHRKRQEVTEEMTELLVKAKLIPSGAALPPEC